MTVHIVGAARTPLGRLLGKLGGIPAPTLGALAIREAIRRTGIDPAETEEVFLGCALPAGIGPNPARQAALTAGLPTGCFCVTLDQSCATFLAADAAIRSGLADIVVAGGMDSPSRAPYLLPEAREGKRLGSALLVDPVDNVGLGRDTEATAPGPLAERLAREEKFPREELDAFALHSINRAREARDAGCFQEEIVPAEIEKKDGAHSLMEMDETLQNDLPDPAGAPPFFHPDGRITESNSAAPADGAAAAVLMSDRALERSGAVSLARLEGFGLAGLHPDDFLASSLAALRNLEKRTTRPVVEADLVELDEIFAVQVLSVIRGAGLDPARVNIQGGALALGHPAGGSGARLLVTLLHAMRRREAKRGILVTGTGTGNGLALELLR